MRKKLRAVRYIFKQSVVSLTRNWYMLLASVFVLFASLFIMGSLGLASLNVRHILNEQADRPEVEIICYSEITDEASLEIARVILKDSRVDSYYRVSRAENLERMKAMMEDYADLFSYDDADSSYLYVSFDITLKDANDLERFTDDMKKVSGVEEVQSNQSVHDYFSRFSLWVRTGTYVALFVLGFLSVLLMLNTIRLTVLARQKELRIMKYVGASNAYMRGPFIAEGLVIGLIGAVLTFFAEKGAYAYLYNVLEHSEESVRKILTLIPFGRFQMKLLGLFVLGGVVTGLLSSMLAIKKYIKV